MKILNMRHLLFYLLTFLNILKIYFITSKKFKNNKKLKFIFFYFPVKSYQEKYIGTG